MDEKPIFSVGRDIYVREKSNHREKVIFVREQLRKNIMQGHVSPAIISGHFAEPSVIGVCVRFGFKLSSCPICSVFKRHIRPETANANGFHIRRVLGDPIDGIFYHFRRRTIFSVDADTIPVLGFWSALCAFAAVRVCSQTNCDLSIGLLN